MTRFRWSAIPGTSGARHPFFSPDGAELAFESGSALKRVTLGEGASVAIADLRASFFGATWTHDDRIIFGTRGPGLVQDTNQLEMMCPLILRVIENMRHRVAEGPVAKCWDNEYEAI